MSTGRSSALQRGAARAPVISPGRKPQGMRS